MRLNRLPRVIALAAAISVAASTVASAQIDEPIPTPPPTQFKGVRTAVITSTLTDPAINEIITATAAEAHRAIGGTRKRFASEIHSNPRNVTNAGRDAADGAANIVILSGGDSQLAAAHAGIVGSTAFLDISQPVPCVTPDGIPDPSRTCAGTVNDLPFNYSVVTFAVDEGAYLAGVVAASTSHNNRLGIISGLPSCEECNRYAEGFVLGAQSVKPEIEIEIAYLADDDIEAAFGDPIIGQTFAEAFINVHRPDVLLPIAGASTRGMIEAACDAGVLAIGTEGDISALYPDLAGCILASVTKDYRRAVSESVFSATNETHERARLLNLANEGIVATEEWRQIPGLPVDLPTRYDTALLSIKSGVIETCPTVCRDTGETEDAIETPDEPDVQPSADPDADTP